jgi:hypothetical protein
MLTRGGRTRSSFLWVLSLAMTGLRVLVADYETTAARGAAAELRMLPRAGCDSRPLVR